MRTSLVTLVISLGLSLPIAAPDLQAQDHPLLRSGARVKLLDFATQSRHVGRLIERRADSLVLQLEQGPRHAVAPRDLRMLEVEGARSRLRGLRHGQSWGAVLGIIAGVGIHFAGEWFSDAPFADAGPQVIISATGLGGALIGGAAGFIVGRKVWHEVPLPLAAPPSTGSTGGTPQDG